MGLKTGLIAAAAWLILWPVAWTTLGMPVPVAVIAWVAGLVAAFLVGRRLGDGRWRTDPVARVEARRRARERFEARAPRVSTETRLARLEREEREAEERAEARVRSIVERRARASGEDPATPNGEPTADPTVAADADRVRDAVAGAGGRDGDRG